MRRERVSIHLRSRKGDEPLTRVVVVHFAGGGYGLYRPSCQLVEATSLVEDVTGTGALRERSATDIEAGNVILIRRGSNPDLIRHEADERLPPGARELARSWQPPLIAFAERHGKSALVLP